MILVEARRLRRWTIGWSGIILLVAFGIVLVIQHAITTVEINGSRWSAADIPLFVFAPLAMFLSMIYASAAGLSLNQEAQTLALSWTKPVSRVAIALRIVAVDLALIVASHIFAWLVILGVLVSARGSIAMSGEALPIFVLALGVAIMWYGLIVALTAALPAGGGAVMGLLWPVALIVSQLRGAFADSTLDTIVLVINTINPLAYMNFSVSADAAHDGGHVAGMGYWQAPPDERAVIVWLLSVVLIAIGVGLWTRREA
jgi:hypothetical protein